MYERKFYAENDNASTSVSPWNEMNKGNMARAQKGGGDTHTHTHKIGMPQPS